MNILNTYKSHFIAAVGSLAFLGLLILLLCIKPFGDSTSKDSDDMLDRQLAIQFQQELMEDVPMQTPSNSPKTSEQSTNQSSSHTSAIPEETENEPGNQEESVMPANIDSVKIAEIKKIMDDLKNSAPIDTVSKEKVQQPNNQQAKKLLADNTQKLFEDQQFYYDNYRAILSLRIVYPYVQKTKEIVNRLNKQLASIKDNKERRRLIKQTEKELFAEFEKDVRNMSTSQGKLLLKLIARETNQTAYGIIKTYKGSIPATFWYGVGLIFHENIKLQYDSLGEDAQLEKIVRKYKLGKL
jgi:hypothetical protein